MEDQGTTVQELDPQTQTDERILAVLQKVATDLQNVQSELEELEELITEAYNLAKRSGSYQVCVHYAFDNLFKSVFASFRRIHDEAPLQLAALCQEIKEKHRED